MDSSLGRLSLATELIILIFEEIYDAYDAIIFGLAHDTLMLIGWEHIRALVAQHIAQWAGGRIICVGSWGRDLPDGLLLGEEEEEYFNQQEPGMTQATTTGPANQYHIPSESFHHENINFFPPISRLQGLSPKEWHIVGQIIMKPGYHSEKGWVLMNLSTKEYVTLIGASGIRRSNTCGSNVVTTDKHQHGKQQRQYGEKPQQEPGPISHWA